MSCPDLWRVEPSTDRARAVMSPHPVCGRLGRLRATLLRTFRPTTLPSILPRQPTGLEGSPSDRRREGSTGSHRASALGGWSGPPGRGVRRAGRGGRGGGVQEGSPPPRARVIGKRARAPGGLGGTVGQREDLRGGRAREGSEGPPGGVAKKEWRGASESARHERARGVGGV